jgi:8-oxo-dGTP diphosphatase
LQGCLIRFFVFSPVRKREKMAINSFTIRAYGLLINKNDEVLVTREMVQGKLLIKFPGGGLEFGEGLKDCLKREFKEELNIEIEVDSHFYTTDYFVQSVFDPSKQVLSVYYKVSTLASIDHLYTEEVNVEPEEGKELFMWKKISEIIKEDFTLPIDQHVAVLLRKITVGKI